MARLDWRPQPLITDAERLALDALEDVGPKARDIAYGYTPKATGHAARSLFYVIVDGNGTQVGGNTTDQNGEPVPAQFEAGQAGWYRLVLGANADYFVWIEVGTSKMPARPVLARTLAEAKDELERALARRSGGRVGLGGDYLPASDGPVDRTLMDF